MKSLVLILMILLISSTTYANEKVDNVARIVTGVVLVKPLMAVGAVIGFTSYIVSGLGGLLGQKDLDEQGIERFTEPLQNLLASPQSYMKKDDK